MAVAMNQILTRWTTASGGNKVSVMYFSAAGDIDDQRLAVNNLFEDFGVGLDTSSSYVIDLDGVVLNDVDGALLDAWHGTTGYTANGDGTGECVADATQVLIRWATDTVVDGRFLKGRTFVPGLGNGNEVGGNLGASAISTFNTIVSTFVAADVGFGIWHRPLKDDDGIIVRPGLFVPVTSGSVWSELAVLRRRRNS